MVVPFSPGGTSDTLARILGQKITEAWGQQVVVDSRPGARGIIGTEIAMRAPADGYTLMHGASEPIFSVRIGLGWRAAGVRSGEEMLWYR